MKEFKKFEDQIKYLKDNKKIIISDKYKSVFQERNYISLINPYKELFAFGKKKDGKHIYVKEIDFEEILSLVKIDDEFSSFMYSLIGIFEKKFKTILFYEICKRYVDCKQDCYCVTYVDEINNFIKNERVATLPTFCGNYYKIITKNNYADDVESGLKKKKDLLEHIVEIGTKVNDGSGKTNNLLIKHYIDNQEIVPLWVIPNALTLGELNILFSMLDNTLQKNIVYNFYNEIDLLKISINDICKFSGYIEMIRRIRNVINHYEPIFPLLVSEMKKSKKIETLQIVKAIKLLLSTGDSSIFESVNSDSLNINKNSFNCNYLKIIDFMKNTLKK